MLTPRSCSQRTFVEPCRNHSSSTTTERTCTFLVVTNGKPVGEIEAHLVAEDAAGAGAGAVGLDGAGGQDAVHQIQVLLHGSSLESPARLWPPDRPQDAQGRTRTRLAAGCR